MQKNMSTDYLSSSLSPSLTSRADAIIVEDLGLRPYGEILELQRSLHAAMVSARKAGREVGTERILLVEHTPVVTLGRHAVRANLLHSREDMGRRGVEVYEIERGGDVTFHGPGQLVVYPLVDLERHRLGVRRYVELLEEGVIRTLAHYGVAAGRVEGATGVWIGIGTPAERKICAIGVKCTRFITMHGLALNVSTDMSYFSLINPCGFVDKGVTSLHGELLASGTPPSELPAMEEVKQILAANLLELLGYCS